MLTFTKLMYCTTIENLLNTKAHSRRRYSILEALKQCLPRRVVWQIYAVETCAARTKGKR